MKTAALCFSLIVLVIVLFALLRTIFQSHFPFVRDFREEGTRQAYILLTFVAIAVFALAHLDLKNLHLESVEVAGIRATVGTLQQKVQTLSEQMELFFKSKRIEVFNQKNWDRVREVDKSKDGVVLEVTLEQEPIPGSVEVLEGVLLMPEQQYRIEGKNVRFPANVDKPDLGLTVKYYPRVPSHQQ